MTLEEIRVEIDKVDTQMKELFRKRMECGKHVAEVKGQTGGDVFVPEREAQIIERRAADMEPAIKEIYIAYIKHLMSLCRKYEYELLPDMQESVIKAALEEANMQEKEMGDHVKISFTCPQKNSNLNLFVNMIVLNQVEIEEMNVTKDEEWLQVKVTLKGTLQQENMRCLLCQIGKEAGNFKICK